MASAKADNSGAFASLLKRFGLLVLLTLFLTSSLAFSLRYFITYGDVKQAISGAAGYAVLAVGIAAVVTGSAQSLFRIHWPALLLVVYGYSSGLWAYNRFEWSKGAAFLATCVGVYLVATLQNSRNFARLHHLLLVVSVCVAGYGLLQWLGIELIPRRLGSGLTRGDLLPRYPASTFGNVNLASHILAPISGLFFAHFLSSRGAPRLGYFLALILCIGYIVVGQTRGGLLIGLSGIAILASAKILSGRIEAARKKRFYAAGAIVVSLVVLGAFASGTIDRFVSPSPTGTPSSTKYRAFLWRDTLKLIEAAPVSGVGLWNYDIQIPRFLSEALQSQQEGIYANERITRAHNDYLNIAAELGIPGLLLFLLFLVRPLSGAISRLRTDNEPGLAAVFLSFLLYSLIDFPLYNPPAALLFFATAGYLAGTRSPGVSVPATCSRRRTCTSAAIAVVAAIYLVGTWGALNWYRFLVASALIRRGESLVEAGRHNESLPHFRSAWNAAPGNRDVYPSYTAALRNTSRFDEATSRTKDWLRLEPNFSSAHNALGFSLVSAGKTDEALAAFLEAYRMAPNNLAAAINAGTIYYLRDDFANAYKYYRAAYERDSTSLKATIRNFADCARRLGYNEEAEALMESLRESAQLESAQK